MRTTMIAKRFRLYGMNYYLEKNAFVIMGPAAAVGDYGQ